MYRATTYSRSEELPSALEDFTSEFDMESGGAPPISSPYTDLELKFLFVDSSNIGLAIINY